jgi:hypothetical protein
MRTTVARAVDELAGVGLAKTACPLLDVTDAQTAKAIAKQAVALDPVEQLRVFELSIVF